MDVEKEEIQAKGIDNQYNRIIVENSLTFRNREGHQSAGSFQNNKP
jgi:hypothetical protein